MSQTPWTPEEYAKLAGFDGDWRDSWWNQDFLQLMSLRWRLDKASTLLDVGCGVGHWGQRLATLLSPEARVFGVDIEKDFVEQAAARAADKGLPQSFEYQVGSADELPFEDNSFDVVTCQTVLIHVPDAPRALAEMRRVLAPGGLLIGAEPNNLVCGLVDLTMEPRPSLDDVAAILRLQQITERGKQALGRGDYSVGERLPAYFSALGLSDLQVYTNDRAPTLYPPYEGRDQQRDIELLEGWQRGGVFFYGGTQADTWTLFEAGGGSRAELETLWAALTRWQKAWLEAKSEQRVSGGRGYLMYLVSGRK